MRPQLNDIVAFNVRSTRHRTAALRTLAVMTLVVLAAGAVGGCPPPKPELQAQFLPAIDLVGRYNARADAIQHIWAKAGITITIPEFSKADADHPTAVTGHKTFALDGTFILRKPRDLYLDGRTIFPPSPMFGVFSNDDMFWYWVKPGDPPDGNTEYRGRYDGPGASKLLMRPDRLLATLGIYALPLDRSLVFLRGQNEDVFQIMGFTMWPDPDHSAAAPTQARITGIYVAQEILLDRYNHDPVEVRLYGSDGEPLVISSLADYAEVDGVRVPRQITFRLMVREPVRTEMTLALKLSDISLTKETRDAAFKYRPGPVDRHIDLDEGASVPEDKPAPTTPPAPTTAPARPPSSAAPVADPVPSAEMFPSVTPGVRAPGNAAKQ